MGKIDWAFAIIIICVFIITVIYAVSCGYNCGRNEIISNLCGKTNGKYDFCVESKEWDIKGV